MTAQWCPRCGSLSHEPFVSETLGLCPDSWHGPQNAAQSPETGPGATKAAPTIVDPGHMLVVADEATVPGDRLAWQARCVCGWQSELGGEVWADRQAAWHRQQPREPHPPPMALAKRLPAGFAWCAECAAARMAGHRCYREAE